MNKDYPNAEILSNFTTITSFDECSDACTTKGASCGGWLLTLDNQDKMKMECQLKETDLQVGPEDWPIDSNSTSYFGTKDCIKSTSRQPAMAEDAEELSYIEICQKNQFIEESKQNNTWDINYCPSK